MNHKTELVILLAFFAILSGASASVLDLTISNSYQRALAAGFTAEFVKNDIWHTHSLSQIKEAFIQGHEHYKIFSGIADWQPLQLILLTFVFFFFGVGKFGMTIVPLAISVLALIYLYRLTRAMYDHKTALVATAITAISTFFFYEAAAPLLENGIALFSTMCVFYFGNYLEKKNNRAFYLAVLAFSLGLLYHLLMLFILPALALVFIYKTNLREFFTNKKNYKMFAFAAGIFVLVFIPFIAG